jgi:hypothetical protein
VSDRTWDRLGAASGLIGVILALIGLSAGGVGASSRFARPSLNATTDQIVSYMGQPAPPVWPLRLGLAFTSFVFLLVFFVRLWATLRTAEGGTAWLSTAGLAGAVVYVVVDLSRFVVTDARYLAAGHHLQAAEGLAFFDLSNALTPLDWIAIAMLMLPASIVAIRARALPQWLAWPGLVIGVANLVWAWLPSGGTGTPAEFAFILWVAVTSAVLLQRPMVRKA